MTGRLLVVVLVSGCVTRTQLCVEAQRARPSADWVRNDSVGASVCVDVEPRS